MQAGFPLIHGLCVLFPRHGLPLLQGYCCRQYSRWEFFTCSGTCATGLLPGGVSPRATDAVDGETTPSGCMDLHNLVCLIVDSSCLYVFPRLVKLICPAAPDCRSFCVFPSRWVSS